MYFPDLVEDCGAAIFFDFAKVCSPVFSPSLFARFCGRNLCLGPTPVANLGF